ncbi:hypothetical protein BGZ65_000160 [Modicella reniformis]|uniref:CUE domain-containing protein n=1 Tax=Modicella reniformis TaxID=1440133 RepID=A0A9P6MAA6_9FUNG|nr:hypothetical protein BGZ65_000160 [Modicella reniformis]
MLSTIDILPFVTPLADPTLTELDFSIAVNDWNEQLSRVLKLNNKAFWTELLQSPSLGRFLNSFLGECASFRGNRGDHWIVELNDVVRRVLMIYRRLSETMAGPEATSVSSEFLADQDSMDPGSAILDQGLVSTSVLMDLAGIYGSADPEGISRIIGAILQNTPSLVGDFRTSTNTVVQIIHRVQKRFEKGVSGGAGKGKGKGKGVSHEVVSESNASDLDHGRLAEVMQYTNALSDIAYAINAVSAVSSTLATELDEHPTFLECLLGCYNYTLPILTKILAETQAIDDINPRSVLTFLRVKMLSIVNNILDGIYRHYMISTSDGPLDTGSTAEAGESAAATLMDRLCEVIVALYEQSPLQDHMVPMLDAPMILDLEIQFCIAEKLSNINIESFNGENDRLNHWVVVLNDLRRLNPATQSFVNEHNMRKSEKMAREMSSLYINQDHGRSSSTVISDGNVPRTSTAAVSADQEGDYVKRTMLISQLQDLFPDLGDGFLEACLINFRDDVELVTMRLLEEDLPSNLMAMDRSTARSISQRKEPSPTSMALVKASSPAETEQDLLSSRRNIFDGDEFDVFSGKVVDRSKVSRGKRGPKDAEIVLNDKTFVTQHKSSILQAVDLMYDDEYDDTYDSMGVNSIGTDFRSVEEVESFNSSGVKNAAGPMSATMDPSIEHEEALINMFMIDKNLFKRSAETRRSKKRQGLRNLTKMSDEQLEGWAVMFDRNPRKAEIAQKYEFRGVQTEIEGTEPIDKRRGGKLPFVDRRVPITSTGAGGQGKKPYQQQKSQPPKDHSQQAKASKPSSQPTSQPSAQLSSQPSAQLSSQPSAQLSSQPSAQLSSQPFAEEQTTSQQTAKTSMDSSANHRPTRERSNNERQKASKANHNRRNQHAKKMTGMHP